MEKLSGMAAAWHEKLFLSVLIGLFAPFKAPLIALLILVLLDTAAGAAYAIKVKNFSLKRFRNGVAKILTYFISITVVRLCELGISSIVSTNSITEIVTSYLVLTETLSVLKNSARLGVPLPAGLVRFLTQQLHGNRLSMLEENGTGVAYIKELEDIIKYQLPNVKTEALRKLLDVKYNEWALLINLIDTTIGDNKFASNELLYYKVKSLSDTTRLRIKERFKDEDVPASCMNCYEKWIKARVDEWEDSMWKICNGNGTVLEKKKLLIDKAITLLYKIIVDVQKGDICLCSEEMCPVSSKVKIK